jgi:hypothetical protein
MKLAELQESLSQDKVPAGLSAPLQALWADAKGDWDEAHRIVQSGSDSDSAWVHAYLHRKEGDLSNASYWYHRAGKDMPDNTLSEEWQSIAKALLRE